METPNLGLPYIMAAQSQKHVTHNEAIRALDALVQLSVLDRGLSTPPGAPVEGARYIVAASPTDAWSGHAGHIAAWQDGAWIFYPPAEGWIAWIADENAAVVWSGSEWSALTTSEGGGGSGPDAEFDTVSINGAAADATNRLSLNAPATLLNHAGNGHQLKINKATAGDTASLLYQTGFSGRAEMGLTGDDDCRFKVSPNGATWYEAIVIDKDTGAVSFPNSTSGGGGGGSSPSQRNRWINGALAISQQNINASATTDAYYVADQLSVHRVTSAGTITVQRVQAVTPGGAADRARVTITTADASLAAGEYLYARTRLEGQSVADFRWGSASARQAILRFLFKGPAGTYAVRLTNSAKNRSYVATFSPAAANTDQIIELVIPGDTSGTWLTTNGIGIEICIVLACGSTFQGSTGWQAGDILGTSGVSNGMGTGSAVFELGEFGFYIDPDAIGSAPLWELPDFASELARCQRYYEKSYALDTAPGALTQTGATGLFCVGGSSAAYLAGVTIPWKVQKRVAPTVTTYSFATGASGKIRDIMNLADVNASLESYEYQALMWATNSTAAGGYNFQWHWTADARL